MTYGRSLPIRLALAAMVAVLGVSVVPGSPLRAAEQRDPNIAAVTTFAPDSDDLAVLRAARAARGAKILVSTRARQLWLVSARGDTLLSAPVAVGMGKDFSFNGKKYHFDTPTGRRRVLKKEEDPVWTVPNWHYYEKAAARGLEVVYVQPDSTYPLADGSFITMRDGEVGRVNIFGNFWPFTPGIEILFDGKIFVPPITSPQRRVPNALGPYKLDTGDGYLIHGTHIYNRESIGQAVSHGCVRMNNSDLERLYHLVEVGTPVFIY